MLQMALKDVGRVVQEPLYLVFIVKSIIRLKIKITLCMYVSLCVYVFIHVWMHVWMCLCMYLHIHGCKWNPEVAKVHGENNCLIPSHYKHARATI